MSDTADDKLAELEAALQKMRKRQRKREAAAFAKGMMQGVCSILTPRDVVLDCGANVGVVTTQLAATGAHVHAFEPDPFAFEKLTAAVGSMENVTVHKAAVGLDAGTVTLMRAANFADNPKGASVKSTVVSGGRGIDEIEGTVEEVKQISLLDQIDTLCSQHGEIAFLKLDIEGAELPILEAMLEQRLFDRIRLTVAETHERKFKELRPRFKALRAAVSEAYPVTRVNLDWI